MAAPEAADATGAAGLWSTVKTLADALWFPAFFAVGFMVFYLIPFHAPAPHDLPVAVQGEQAAASVQSALDEQLPGGFDVAATADAEQAVLDRDAVAAYAPADRELFVAGAMGMALEQATVQPFTALAEADGGTLAVTDAAPAAAGDSMGMSLFYLVLTWTITGYIGAMMVRVHAGHLAARTKMLALAGFGAFTSVFCYAFGAALHVVPDAPAVMLVAFMLNQSVAWTVMGIAPFVKKWLPGVAMLIFVLLSMPASGGAIPLAMVPDFFQALHPFLPMGQAMDAIRGLLYFNGVGVAGPSAVLVAWLVLGGLLAAAGFRKEKRDAEGADGDGPALAGTVTGDGGAPLPGAVVTVLDHAGAHVAELEAGEDGAYRGTGLPEGVLTVLASAPGRSPRLGRITLGAPTGADAGPSGEAAPADGAGAADREGGAAGGGEAVLDFSLPADEAPVRAE
ncbi:carboxypeptidase regulatory-like domain-containing protein [Nocardiopsis coralliicola]